MRATGAAPSRPAAEECFPARRAISTPASRRSRRPPTRLQILRLVERAPSGEACVCDLADCLGFRQPTISHHLKVMTDTGLLNRERRGTWSWYSVNLDGLRRVREILEPVPR